MKKKFIAILVVMTIAVQLSACSFKPHCKVDGCDETEIYEDGYCKFHYYENVGGNIIKDIVN